MPFTTKRNKRIKVQGSLETLRHKHFIWPPTLGRSIVINDLKRRRRRRRRRRKKRRVEEEENSQFYWGP